MEDLQRNEDLAAFACLFATEHGCNPIAPHLFFPEFLDDDCVEDRAVSFECGLGWLAVCDEIWVIGTRVTKGMAVEMREAKELGIPSRRLIFFTDLDDDMVETESEDWGLDCFE